MTTRDEHEPDTRELCGAQQDAVQSYNAPPDLARADLDAMWSAIEAKAFRADIGGRVTERGWALREVTRRWFAPRTLVPIAATLVLGVALGRFSAPNAFSGADVPPGMTPVDSLSASPSMPEPYHSTTSRYLGQTAALLVSLPSEARDGDDRFTNRAHDLLLTTRLLLDSPASRDPGIRNLLEDLELVLAQVVRLQSGHGDAELELIRQALDQRDVLPRLRSAVADIAANE